MNTFVAPTKLCIIMCSRVSSWGADAALEELRSVTGGVPKVYFAVNGTRGRHAG